MDQRKKFINRIFVLLFFTFLLVPSFIVAQEGLIPRFELEKDDLTLERLAQPHTYFDKVGRKFAILGTESGAIEAWAYPLKLLRSFTFSFLLKNSTQAIPARDIVRFVSVTPAATTLTYTFQSFTVRATYIASIDEPGALILLEVDAVEPLTIITGFLPVLQPMWPAGLGGQYASWDDDLRAYLISEPTRMNHGYVGSPAARGISYTPAHMLSDTPNEFTIAVEKPDDVRDKFIPIILAGGKGKREDIRKVYERLEAEPAAVYRSVLDHYKKLRQETLRIELPDRRLNLGFEWAKVSYDNLLVDNPDLGLGLVAGLGLSGTGGRPGFGWFFGGDAYLNSLSLVSFGAADMAKTALAFTQKWQREDGKMAHELSQAAAYINWFDDYPYGYIHGDTTPYYIVAVYDYYLKSGDLTFVRRSWPSLEKAYRWCLSMDGDGDGLMDNRKAGLGALEFGTLTDIQTDIYLASVWALAALAMEKMAVAVGQTDIARRAAADHKKASSALEEHFWDEKSGHYSYAFDAAGRQVRELTPWYAVSLIWQLGNPERSRMTLEKLASAEMSTDWGVRILSSKSPLYEPLNYNYGAVWPFLTGLLAVAQYKHDFHLQAYQNLLATAGHVFQNALGHVTELYSGAHHAWPQEAVPHQGFSAGGVILPLVRGLLGLEGDAPGKRIIFEPRFPADWRSAEIENFRLGGETFGFRFERKEGRIRLEVKSRPGNGFRFSFAPSLGPGAEIITASLNGNSQEFEIESSARAVRPALDFALSGRDIVDLEFNPSVEVLPPVVESRVGDFNRGLKVIQVEQRKKILELVVEGLAGERYSLELINAGKVEDVAGAELSGNFLFVKMAAGKEREYLRQKIVLRLK